MNDIATSPLPALIRYYERLATDPNQSVADFGFSRQKISFVVVVECNGALHAIQDAREERLGKPVPKPLLVPGQSKPSGQGINPCFLWDNARYMLGFRSDDDDPDRTVECFKAFRQAHLDREADIRDEAFTAVCRFLTQWDPRLAAEQAVLVELGHGFGVFRLRAHQEHVHNRSAVLSYWNRQLATQAGQDQILGPSLVSGAVEPLARLHEPKIQGVAGAQSSGAVLVGFNDSAYESYGKTQSYNAPVGVRDAFRYATALNLLLADDTHRVRIGDATVVFWTDRAEAKGAEEVFAAFFGEQAPKGQAAESGKMVDRLREFLEAARQGRLVDNINDPDAPFYILGLSPNISRINIRYWLTGTVVQFAERLARHERDLEMVGARPEAPPLMIRGLIYEAMPEATSASQEKYVAQLAGEVARAVLGGLPYPQSLFNAIIRRIRADAAVNHRRAAILKAYLVRNWKMEVPMALDKDYRDEAYHLGRLFAALEKTQEDATDGKLNSTIKDRYFGAASATPASVFPRLLRLHQHHMDKVENAGLRVNREKLIGEICGHIRHFPSHLTLEKQGLFHIAYYHQRSDFFTKKDSTEKEMPNE